MRAVVKWVALAGLPLVASACFSSSAGPSGPDAGSDDGPTADATSPDLDGSSPDGFSGSLDASPDSGNPSATPDATPDVAVMPPPSTDAGVPVTVVVTSGAGPEQGVTVVFDDGFGQILGTATTDGTGRAGQVVPAGSQVTAVMGSYLAPQIATIQGVAPGDVLSFYDASYEPPPFDVNVAIADSAVPPDGTSRIRAQIGSCEAYDVPGVVSVNQPGCTANGQFPLLAVAEDSYSDDLAYTYMTGNPVATDGGAVTVTMPGPWYTPVGSQTLSIVNGIGAYAALSLGPIAGGVETSVTDTEGYSTDPNDSFSLFPGYGEALQAEANFTNATGSTTSTTGVATRGASDGGPISFDFALALPFIDSVAIDTTVIAQPIVTWGSSTGSLAAADGVLVQIAWSNYSNTGSVNGSWTFLAPGTASSITAPALSAPAALWLPTSSAYFATPVVAVIEADFITSYAQLRGMASSLPLTTNLIDGNSGNAYNDAPPLPVDGTLRYTAITVNGD